MSKTANITLARRFTEAITAALTTEVTLQLDKTAFIAQW